MRPGRTLRLAVVAALAAGCAVAAAPAVAGTAHPPRLAAVPADALTRALTSGQLTEAEYALERARSLFALPAVRTRFGSVQRAGPRDATIILRDLLVRMHELSPAEQEVARRITARPTEPGDPFTRYSVPEAPNSPLCATNVCVHYVVASPDAPPLTDANANGHPDWIDSAAAELEIVWAKEVVEYGYRAPKPDLASDDPGPDGRLDVYIADVGGDRLYGYCTSDDPNLSPQYPFGDVSGYCVLDDDYASSQFPAIFGLDALRVTAAHEFFHAVQFAYDIYEDAVLMEGTATWMEDEVYDAINDNYQYLAASALSRPEVPFDLALSNPGNDDFGFQYGAWIFYRYLTERLGPELVRRIWELADFSPVGPDLYSLEAMDAALQERDSTLRGRYAGFAAANAFPARSYEEGAAYPSPPLARRLTLTSTRRQRSGFAELDHLTSWYGAFQPGAGVARNAKLRIQLDLPSRARGSEATLLTVAVSGQVTTLRLGLDSTGDVKRTVAFGRGKVKAVILVLTNASARYTCFRGSVFACMGQPLDDELEFAYRAALVQPR
jgi:hypothetical protein